MTSRNDDDRPTLLSGRAFPLDITILIVEDESIVAWDVEQLFRDYGVKNILSAQTLGQAKEFLIQHHDIAVVLLDLKLNDGLGSDLIDELTGRSIPIVITTGYFGHEDHRFPVLFKPYSSMVLLETVLDAIHK